MTTTNPHRTARTLHTLVPAAHTLGIDVLSWTPAETRLRLAWARELCTAEGVLHGGVLMTLADTAGAACAYVGLPDGATTTTIESKTNFFRSVGHGDVVAFARPLHRGRNIIVVGTDLTDSADRPVAHVVQSQTVSTG
ncbi:PaaI family thioesterase [Saccharomonospora halophila]|uniref:PaaI family thioesterase n=1 Tax=Saccharomonospora halophila TaxID=129922 RepID=UPI0003770575|nr:PaaI family thioesterase [Saccharomonospora halophila]